MRGPKPWTQTKIRADGAVDSAPACRRSAAPVRKQRGVGRAGRRVHDEGALAGHDDRRILVKGQRGLERRSGRVDESVVERARGKAALQAGRAKDPDARNEPLVSHLHANAQQT